MATTTIPVTYAADANARLDELGLHAVCEEIIEHILETVPNLQRLEVTCPYNEVLGPDQQIVFDAYVTGPRTIEPDWQFMLWNPEHIPWEARRHFVMMTASE